MTEEKKLKSVNGSSSAFAFGGVAYTESRGGCFRNILLKSKKIDQPFPAHLSELGARNEESFLERHMQGVEHDRESVVKEPIPGYPDVQFSGRIDFLLPDVVIELKSISSKFSHADVIGKGLYKLTNLAQAVSYMISKEINKGQLIYSSWLKPKINELTGKEEPGVERAFEINLDADGVVWVDGKATAYTARDQLEHRITVAKVITEGVVWPSRPKDGEVKFKGACHWCPFKQACDMFDAGVISTTEEFLNQAKECIK